MRPGHDGHFPKKGKRQWLTVFAIYLPKEENEAAFHPQKTNLVPKVGIWQCQQAERIRLLTTLYQRGDILPKITKNKRTNRKMPVRRNQ